MFKFDLSREMTLLETLNHEIDQLTTTVKELLSCAQDFRKTAISKQQTTPTKNYSTFAFKFGDSSSTLANTASIIRPNRTM